MTRNQLRNFAVSAAYLKESRRVRDAADKNGRNEE